MAAKRKAQHIGQVIPMSVSNLKRENIHKNSGEVFQKIHTKIAVPTSNKIELIDTSRIIYLKAISNYTEIYLVDGSTILTSITLKKYEEKLNASEFIRVHNSFLIQRSQLKSYLPKQSKIMLHNAQEIPVSRSKKEGLMKYLKLLMVSLLFFLFATNGHTQSYNYFQQKAGDTSDYLINIEWQIQTNATSCDCVPGANSKHEIHYIDPNFSNDVLFTTYNGQQGAVWEGVTVANSKFPGYSINYYGYVENTSATFDFFEPGDCLNYCPYNVTHPNVLMSSQPLKNAKNLKIFHEDNGSARFTWDVVTDIPYGYELRIKKNNVLVQTIYNKNTETWIDDCPTVNDVFTFTTYFFDGFNIANAETSALPITFTQQVYDSNIPQGKISGRITTAVGNAAVEGVLVTAELQNPNGISNGNCWPQSYTDISDANGDYTLPFMYYGVGAEEALYKVTPTLSLHGFNPGEIIRPLKNGSFQIVQNFVDTTSFVISGTIYDNENCGVDSVLIFTTSGDFASTYSKPDGTYDLVVPQTGNYTFKAVLDTLELGSKTLNVQSSTANHNFFYTETNTITLFVGAGCYEPIGTSLVEFRTKGGCLLQTLTTNMSGYLNDISLPKREITMQVISYNPGTSGLDANTVLNDINDEIPFNLQSDTTYDIFYRRPISLEYYGVPAPPCAATPYPVFNQAQNYPIVIQVWEQPGICASDTGYIIVQDNMAGSGLQTIVLDTIPVSNGQAIYNIIPGEPELSAPYLKTISFAAFVDGQSAAFNFEGIVSGTRQRTQTFITGAPTELPYLILRDPPGDRSFSFFESTATTTYAQSYSALVGGGVRAWVKASAEANIFGLKIFGEIGGGIAAGGSRTSTDEITTTLSHNTSIKTSAAETVIGGDGDLVYGAAVNFIYGIADGRIFDINTCQIVVDTNLVFSPDTFQTKFFKTIGNIKNSVIPNLLKFASNPDTTEEARRKFRNEARKWQQVIQLNDDLKAEALASPIENYTIDAAAGPIEFSTTGSTTEKKMLEFQQYVNVDISGSAGIDFFGAFTVEAGLEVTIRGEFGQSESSEITAATTTGFKIDDEGEEFIDEFSFDYAVDEVYGTPVFGASIGMTSCPHEEGTQFIDFPSITTAVPVKFVQSGNAVEFVLKLKNNSESDDTRTYQLDFVEQSNEFGALVFDGANPFSGTIPVTLSAGASVNKTIRIERSEVSEQYSFEGLQFDLYPTCEPLLKSSTYISAYFTNTCSNIGMPSPANDWLANEGTNNLLPVTMAGYTLGPEVDFVKMVYSPIGSQEWTESNIMIPGANLLAPPQTYNWNTTNVPDGLYNIRFELNCGGTVNVSTRTQGRIDRSCPQVVGNEKPSDDAYHPGDEISVSFNEILDGSTLIGSNVYFISKPNNQVFPAQFVIIDNKVILVPGVNIDSMYNQMFEIGLINVTDLYNNVRPDTVSWQFTVSEPDSDRDGVPDTKDRCPGGNDFEDTDMDGLPDDCDCVPTINTNGRQITKASMGFDGNQLISIPNNPAIIPSPTNEMTMELWLNPIDTAANYVDIIASSSGNLYLTRWSFGMQIFTGVYTSRPIFISPYEWTHLAVVFTSTGIKVYTNGNLVDDFALTHAANAGNPLTIGGNIGEPLYRMDGRMDEFRIWNDVRTQAEIQANMNMEIPIGSPGLILHYAFNEGTPNGNNTDLVLVKNQANNNFHGTLEMFDQVGMNSNWVNGFPPISNYVIEPCRTCKDTLNTTLDFDGINDRVDIADQSDFSPITSNAMTFEAWVFPGNKPGFNTIVSKAYTNSTDYMIYLEGNKLKLFMQYSIPSIVISLSDIPDLKWTHVAVEFNLNEVKFYINGVLDITQTINLPSTMPASPLRLGDLYETLNLDANFKGRMDDVRFWNDVRTPTEIADNLYTELIGDEAGLVAYYNFNEGLPSQNNDTLNLLTDVTGNGNDGTLTDFNKFGGFSNWVKSPMRFSGDVDEDGRPDVCDNCVPSPILGLNNQSLNGIYIARDEIILGAGITFPADAEVTFRAPQLTLQQNITKPANVKITVKDAPCDE